MDLLTIGTFATAAMSAAAAIGSWRSAKQSATIEQERHRAELRPQLDLRIAADDGGRAAVMYVTLNGPVDLPTPGRIRLSLVDLPSDLRNEVLATYALGQFELSFGKSGAATQIWGPWEFLGGLKKFPSTHVFISDRFTWNFRFALCRPARRLPNFSYARSEAIRSRHKRQLRVTSFRLDGVLFQFAVFVGQRVRTMRRVRLNETQTMRLSRTSPPVDADWARDKDWVSLYPPDKGQVLANCKFGKWRWRIELQATTIREPRGGPIIDP